MTRTIGGAAVLIAALTAAGRVIGFGRQLVFAHTVANSCLGSAYTTANLVPNIIYDIVLGGALASIMVPVLGLGNTVGLVVSGAVLLAAVRRARGSAALQGTGRAAAAGLAGAVAGAAAGAGTSAAIPVTGFFPNATVAVAACCGAVIAFGVMAYALDGGDLRAVVARTKRKVMP